MAFVGSVGCARVQRRAVVCSAEGSERDNVQSQSRRAVLRTGLSLLPLPIFVLTGTQDSFADVQTETLPETWKGPQDLGFKFSYPSGWIAEKKKIKTHSSEVLVKKENSSARVGLVVDPVKINTLTEFGAPDDVAKKVLGVESKKEGTKRIDTIQTQLFQKDGLTWYEVEYEVENKRGAYHYIADMVINDKNLYVMTAQSKIDEFPMREAILREILNSFNVKPSYNNV
mmetsp:Transcript_11792/g.35963  ORF Transcript_11792/g.35963 Transcript_11792/m.35963 type:complete len:228 (-) Transcript_11792:1027-1710(-)